MRLSLGFVSVIFAAACGNSASPGARPDAGAHNHGDGGATPEPDAPGGDTDAGGDGGVASRTAIVFAAALDGQTEPDLYTIEPDGSGLVRLTTTPAAELYPSWSPDHSRIAFVRDFQLFAIDADGRAESLVAAQTGRERANEEGVIYSTTLGPAAWSPDGSELAYPAPRENHEATSLHIIGADGTGDRPLAMDPGFTINSIAWAPNNTLSFSQSDDCSDCAGGQWYGFANLDGSGYQQLLNDSANPNGPNKHLDWSPDGTRWVYVGGLDYFFYEQPDLIYTSAAFGTDREQLVETPGWNPRWSADGATIAYIAADGIHVIDADRSDARLVLAVTGVRGLDW